MEPLWAASSADLFFVTDRDGGWWNLHRASLSGGAWVVERSLQAESEVGNWRLNDCTLYVTKEPCPMCAGAIVHARLARVVFGTNDPKAGAAGGALNLLQFPTLNHQCEITPGLREDECTRLLKSFFREQREMAKARRNSLVEGSESEIDES